MSVEERLRQLMHERVDELEVPDDRGAIAARAAVAASCRMPRVRRWRVPIALAAAAAVVAGVVVVVTAGSDGGSAPPGPAASITVPPTVVATPTTGPVSTPTPSTVAVETGGEAHDGWRSIAPAPIIGRGAVASVWTGDEMIVWGGLPAAARGGRGPADGAAYDPATDTWRRIADPPDGMVGVAGAAWWTGHDVLLWAGNSPDGPGVGAIYTPATDSWRAMAPSPMSPREGYDSVWTGTELVIVGGTSGDQFGGPTVGAAYDPATDQWRTLPDTDDVPRLTEAAWTGTEVLLRGDRPNCPELGSACQDFEPRFTAYDPANDTYRALAPAPSRTGRIVAWTGTTLLWLQAEPSVTLLGYAPATDTWTPLGDPPCDPEGFDGNFGYSSGFEPVWTGDALLLTCDRTTVEAYVPASASWNADAVLASPLPALASPAQVWTGRDVLVWSGTESSPGNPTPDVGAAFRPTAGLTAPPASPFPPVPPVEPR